MWGKIVVTDQAVTNCISELRHHLGDDRSAHRVIETIPKRGYRLTAPVQLAQRRVTASRRRANRRAVRWPHRRWISRSAAAARRRAARLSRGGGRVASAPALTSVAVLRFENAAGDESLDYLGLALPDEIATLLTKSRESRRAPVRLRGAATILSPRPARAVWITS